jgi:hypothetical protein
MSLQENVAENLSAPETGVSKTSARRTAKLSQQQPCKTTVARALKEHHPVARTHFCNWFLQSVNNGVVDAQFFSDEASFSVRGEVNSQNSLYWSAENPGHTHELLFVTKKSVFGVR